MSTDHTQLTPEQARHQLHTIQSRSLRFAGDRRVYAVGTAISGLALGVFMAARNAVSGTSDILASLVFFVIWLGAAFWVQRATRTVPRRTKLWTGLGIGGSLVVALVAVLPWLNLQAQTEPNTWPMVLLGGLVVAAPSLFAAAVIARGRQ